MYLKISNFFNQIITFFLFFLQLHVNYLFISLIWVIMFKIFKNSLKNTSSEIIQKKP